VVSPFLVEIIRCDTTGNMVKKKVTSTQLKPGPIP